MDDLISRQAAINVADGADYTGLSIENVKKVTDEVVKGLKKLPPAQLKTSRIENALHGKSAEEQYDFLKWLMLDYAMWSTDSRVAVIEWLEDREKSTMEEYMYGQEGSEEDGSL